MAMRSALGLVLSLLLVSPLACGGGGGGTHDAATKIDGGGDAPATSCPTDQPDFTTACAAALTCHYGHASCCGIPSSAQTCLCQHGFFNCFQTVECNFVCPDAGND
jgi:hypothetical protein